MKKLRIPAVCAALCLLTGCGTSPADTAESSASSEAETSAEVVIETEAPELDGYQLLWHDEFDGSVLNDAIWNREKRDPGWTNEELQEYTESDENIFLRDGCLILKAVKSDRDGKDYYTSGKVNSQNKTDFIYGKVVARAKVPEGQGLWPAIWMMPQDESRYGQWPKCGEIDIMEVLGNQTDTAYGTVHYGAPHADQQGTVVLDSGTFASDFH
ncbi:MAG: glycoside hydrolase family 16 protein, partial [Oscillospiraceae bacterium]|nr:glycoside hydrolase family 16 protein [Oscillospiraceae bacterium]